MKYALLLMLGLREISAFYLSKDSYTSVTSAYRISIKSSFYRIRSSLAHGINDTVEYDEPAVRITERIRKGSAPEFSIAGDSTEVTPFQLGIVLAHFVLVALNVGIAFTSISAWGFSAALSTSAAAMIASIVLGDLGTGVFHWSVDNYGSLKTPIFGSVCAAFQGHHTAPWTITYRPFANNVYKIAIATVPVLTLLSLAPINLSLRIFFSLFINWWLVSQELHKFSHMKQVPPLVKFLQDNRIILSRKEHCLHHNSPFEGHYCILTGACNQWLDKSNFFRHLERLVFKLTGNFRSASKIAIINMFT